MPDPPATAWQPDHYRLQVIASAAVNWHRATDTDIDETCRRLHQVVADYLTAGGGA